LIENRNHLNVQAAVNAPRIHHQWLPDEIRIEEGFSPDTIRLLEAMGHTVTEMTLMGAIQGIMVSEDGAMFGGADPRRSTSTAMGFNHGWYETRYISMRVNASIDA
jgi:gamma-glutamyltranspeptidase/glutathione hydrolase